MLVLGRKLKQTILIGPDIQVTVLEVDGNEVKLGIEAPRAICILRQEVVDQVKMENRRASQTPFGEAAKKMAAVAKPQAVGRTAVGQAVKS